MKRNRAKVENYECNQTSSSTITNNSEPISLPSIASLQLSLSLQTTQSSHNSIISVTPSRNMHKESELSYREDDREMYLYNIKRLISRFEDSVENNELVVAKLNNSNGNFRVLQKKFEQGVVSEEELLAFLELEEKRISTITKSMFDVVINNINTSKDISQLKDYVEAQVREKEFEQRVMEVKFEQKSKHHADK